MNTEKIGNLLRVVAVILIAIVALLLIGATSGSDSTPEVTPPDNNQGDTAPPDTITPEGDDTDTNPPAQQDTEEEVYISALTGLIISKEENLSERLALVYSPNDTLYGISSADIVIEIPISSNATRYLVYTSTARDLSKVGTISPVRDNMLALYNSFGGIFVAKGNDSCVKYEHSQALHIDLSSAKDYAFNESVSNTYTTGKLLLEYMKDNSTATVGAELPTPFVFSDEDIYGRASCNVITLPFSTSCQSVLVYDKNTLTYSLLHNSKTQVDMLSGASAAFTNAFVLFSDATTYERSDLIETVTETLCGGAGYYLSLGKLTEIRWEADSDGAISFKTLSGDTLKINKGKSYIGYFKSSERKAVTFE